MAGQSFLTRYQLTELLTIAASGEEGQCIGIAVYTNRQTNYLIRYKAADGRAVEAWWDEDALRGSDEVGAGEA